MGGDLNLKKSWHPHLRKNQEKVWLEEKAALDERKIIEKLRREREEERALEELQRLQEASGGKTVAKKVDWMYAGPSGDGAQVTEERESYLLGKRRIDNLLKDTAASQALAKGAAIGAGIDTLGSGSGNANSALDVKMKVAQDPLLAIQKQRMEMQVKMMRDAQRKAKSEEKHAKEKERERKHKHRSSRRDRSRDREEDDERDRRHRHSRRDRSRSRDSSDERDRRHRHRHRSRSPRRRDSDDRKEYRRRSRSPRRREYREERDDYRKRSRSPYRRKDRSDRDRDDRPPRPSRSFDNVSKSVEKKDDGPSAADRLAQMQANADTLEQQRLERVRLIEEQDRAEQEKHRNQRDGGRKFISGMRGQASDMSLGDVMARGRQGYRKEVDV